MKSLIRFLCDVDFYKDFLFAPGEIILARMITVGISLYVSGMAGIIIIIVL